MEERGGKLKSKNDGRRRVVAFLFFCKPAAFGRVQGLIKWNPLQRKWKRVEATDVAGRFLSKEELIT
jgi:hypothetical protein